MMKFQGFIRIIASNSVYTRCKKFILLVCISVLIQGCATVITGTKDDIYIHSTPEGADIYINNIKEGVTPSEIVVKRYYNKKNVTIKKEGYKSVEFPLQKSFNPWIILSIPTIYGVFVDIATGAALRLDKTYYEIDLELKEYN